MIRRYISRTLQNYILLNIHKERMSSNRSFDIDRIYSNMVNALWIVLLPFEFAIMSILSHLFGLLILALSQPLLFLHSLQG